jgi:hypothetical protein
LQDNSWFCNWRSTGAAFKSDIIGQGKGSLYTVCGGQDPRLNSFAPVNFAEKTACNLSYYFYNILNPVQYLFGDDAVVVEKGPYMIKKYSTDYNINFTKSSLTLAYEYDSEGLWCYSIQCKYLYPLG